MRSERDGVFIRTCVRPVPLSCQSTAISVRNSPHFVDDPFRDPHHPMLRVGCKEIDLSWIHGSYSMGKHCRSMMAGDYVECGGR